MNRQVGGSTAAFQSKAFPYLIINAPAPRVLCGNLGGPLAFFERLRFSEAHREDLELMGVFVGPDAGLHGVAPEHRRKLMRWIHSFERSASDRGDA